MQCGGFEILGASVAPPHTPPQGLENVICAAGLNVGAHHPLTLGFEHHDARVAPLPVFGDNMKGVVVPQDGRHCVGSDLPVHGGDGGCGHHSSVDFHELLLIF
jgi:hypothetical protein